jgi:glycine/D-amino acid oxidase-like deaminating enzyme
MVLPEPEIGARVLPADPSALVTGDCRDKGVEPVADAPVTGIQRTGGVARVATKDGPTLEADVVVALGHVDAADDLIRARQPIEAGALRGPIG